MNNTIPKLEWRIIDVATHKAYYADYRMYELDRINGSVLLFNLATFTGAGVIGRYQDFKEAMCAAEQHWEEIYDTREFTKIK